MILENADKHTTLILQLGLWKKRTDTVLIHIGISQTNSLFILITGHKSKKGKVKMKTIITALLALSLVGCASIHNARDLAQSGQWQKLGLGDGQLGYVERSEAELSGLGSLKNQSLTQYRSGYEEGIKEFCRLDEAFFAGLSGRPYRNQCDGQPDAKEIEHSWEDGLNQYHAQKQFFFGEDTAM